ncbi:hypothetical protein Sme01_03940 [Sphaerisporangium melleum]|uniref:Uncharacterized protein n=1 Tax=Sphaerisporangium melleum TaxID=321316 RepID=A0A917QPL7_9ACTN|nr:hypothetical protein [Sphaerisporangium melleum]GGK62020.1 hypothetical protein GCM10007964_01490 [Sphaerisporangium melleum]GII67918.1 hypothetical protein Sme01_03940 [Sphaerisporangium melleum]
MAEPMSTERLAEIRDREQKAAPGPYVPEWDSCDCDDAAGCGLGHRWVTALRLPEPHTRSHTGEPQPWEFLYSEIGQFAPDTALFFATAGEDVRALLAEVERLNRVVGLLGRSLQSDSQDFIDVCSEVVTLRQDTAELEQMVAELTAKNLGLIGERDRLREAWQNLAKSMREIHGVHPMNVKDPDPARQYCEADGEPWPCPTYRLVMKAVGE